MKIKTNPMNPEDIKPGDYVKLVDPRKGDPRGKMLVETVRGTYNNKVYCEKIGHELYANCFKKVVVKVKVK